MKSLLLLVAVALTGTALITASAPAAVAPTPEIVITVRSIETSSTPDDKPPAGPSKGDRFLIRDDLRAVGKQFGKKAGTVVGTDAGLFTLTSKTAGTVVGVAVLPGGRVRFHGVLRFKGKNPPFKVDGGTGRYAHAHGTLLIGTGETPLNVYRLTLAGTGGPGTTV
jgi:hypothetical protein